MESPSERTWTAHVVIASEHAGLKLHCRALEDELYRVLARVDNPAAVCAYLMDLKRASRRWLQQFRELASEK